MYLTSRNDILDAFDAFRVELDDHNDRRERLIKTSRDVTNLSKKVIFLLHRLVADSTAQAFTVPATQSEPGSAKSALNLNVDAQKALADAAAKGREKLAEAQAMFRGMRSDLAGAHFWRYQSAISPGLQEYIEALAFSHYLQHRALITIGQVQATLSDKDGMFFPVSMDDYLLGVSDLMGELMRFAITAISRRGGRTAAHEVSDFVRNCRADFEGFTPYVRRLGAKQDITTQSLLKIEEAAYAMAVRASEYAGSETILEDVVARCVADVRRRQREASDVEMIEYMSEEYC